MGHKSRIGFLKTQEERINVRIGHQESKLISRSLIKFKGEIMKQDFVDVFIFFNKI